MCAITDRNGMIGIVKGSGETKHFQHKANFTLTIIAKVEGVKDGYVTRVTTM